MVESLQIRQLSKGGDLIAVVNCLPGKITVFRSDSPQELIAFQRVLSGARGPDLFNLVLGSNPFNPHENVLIGFGEHSTIEIELRKYLIESGFPEENLRAQVSAYGLEQDLNTKVSELTRCAMRRVQLLVATYSNKEVFVLNDPFEPIASIWKERFAELLLNDAVSRKRISVVVSLTQRPECWVGAENVVRVHVGANVQKTVGFGGGTDQVNQLVAELRKSLKVSRSEIEAKPQVQATARPSVDSTPQQMASEAGASPLAKSPRIRPQMLGAIGIGFVLLLLVLDRVGAYYRERVPQAGKQATPSTQSVELAKVDDVQKLPGPSKEVDNQPTLPKKTPAEEVKVVKRELLLEGYPTEIGQSILAAFDEKEISTAAASSVVVNAGEASNPFAGLQGLPSGPSTENVEAAGAYIAPANNLPWVNPAQAQTSGDEEERRRQIREKFLEAIRRAAEQRQQANY